MITCLVALSLNFLTSNLSSGNFSSSKYPIIGSIHLSQKAIRMTIQIFREAFLHDMHDGNPLISPHNLCFLVMPPIEYLRTLHYWEFVPLTYYRICQCVEGHASPWSILKWDMICCCRIDWASPSFPFCILEMIYFLPKCNDSNLTLKTESNYPIQLEFVDSTCCGSNSSNTI